MSNGFNGFQRTNRCFLANLSRATQICVHFGWSLTNYWIFRLVFMFIIALAISTQRIRGEFHLKECFWVVFVRISFEWNVCSGKIAQFQIFKRTFWRVWEFYSFSLVEKTKDIVCNVRKWFELITHLIQMACLLLFGWVCVVVWVCVFSVEIHLKRIIMIFIHIA